MDEDKIIDANSSSQNVFHYTSPYGLYSILDKKALMLRFTDCRFFNDKSEYIYFRDLFKEVLNTLDSHLETFAKLVLVCFNNDFDEVKSQKVQYPLNSYFVFCTSLERDSLTMWNYYAKEGSYQGYNIGISATELGNQINKINNVKCFHNKVIYLKDKQIKIIRSKFNDWCKNISKNEDARVIFPLLQREIRNFIEETRLFFKHEAFRNENEYRFVIKTSYYDKHIEHDVKNGIITPFYKCEIDKATLNSITIAPLIEQGITIDALSRLLHLNGYCLTEQDIICSNIPSRY